MTEESLLQAQWVEIFSLLFSLPHPQLSERVGGRGALVSVSSAICLSRFVQLSLHVSPVFTPFHSRQPLLVLILAQRLHFPCLPFLLHFPFQRLSDCRYIRTFPSPRLYIFSTQLIAEAFCFHPVTGAQEYFCAAVIQCLTISIIG